MKSLAIFLAFFVCFVASQDVAVPRDLLEGSSDNKTNATIPEAVQTLPGRPVNGGGFLRDQRPIVTEETGFVPSCFRQPPMRSNSRMMNAMSNCDVVTPYPGMVDEIEPEPEDIIERIPEFREQIVPEFEYREQIVDIETVCPIGQIRTSSGCVSQQQECPEGHERRGGRCVRIYTECPTGFRRDGSRCVQIVQCPRNYEMRGDRCVLNRPDCSEGYYWNGQQCLISEIECPTGYVYSNGQCIREVVTCLPEEINVDGECRAKVVECPSGYTRTSSGTCERRTQTCPAGFLWNGTTCSRRTERIRLVPQSTPPPASLIRPPPGSSRSPPAINRAPPARTSTVCPPGYQLYQGMCYMCQDVPAPERRTCQTTTQQNCCSHSSQPAPNINVNVHNAGGGSSGKGYNIVNNIHPANNTIVNINNITAPVTLNNVNENVISIHHGGQCRDGTIKTTVVRNNQTQHSCTDVTKESSEEVVVEQPRKCCTVSTPRQCRQQQGNWRCGHRRYKYCGDFCTSNQVYLRPNVNTVASDVMTFMPVHQLYVSPFGHGGGYVDCSGCQNGSYNCSPQCFSYPCQSGGGDCTFMDQQDFCGTVGGNVCQ